MAEISPDFWQRCAAACCVVLPVNVYSAYGADGNTHPSEFVGIRFAALDFDNHAVGPDYWFMIDEGSTGLAFLFETPEAALEAFVIYKAKRMREIAEKDARRGQVR